MIKKLLILIALTLSLTSIGQTDIEALAGQTLKAYSLDTTNYWQIDSTSTYFYLHIEIPKSNNTERISGVGKIIYNTKYSSCGYFARLIITSDSIEILKHDSLFARGMHDPCRGHTDIADHIWGMLGWGVKREYIWNDNTLSILDNSKPIIKFKTETSKPCAVFIPNAVSRNETYFKINTECAVDSTAFRIYNRWGEIVHKNNKATLPFNTE